MWASILGFVWAQVWCALLMVAFIGYGRLALKYLRQDASIAVEATVGMALFISLGGVLNLLQLITAKVLIGLTVAGVLPAVAQLPRRLREAPSAEISAVRFIWSGSRWTRLLFICFVILSLFRLLSVTRSLQYLETDDENFYLAMPVKMFETHHLAADPFSQRRIESSLGGSYFLQCLVTSALPLENLQMADRSIGFMLLTLLALALARNLGLSPPQMVIFGLLTTLLSPHDTNLTFSVLPSACVFALVWVAMEREPFPGSTVVHALLLGVIAGMLCSFKSTFLPFAALFCGGTCLLLVVEKRWKMALTACFFSLLGAVVILAPWMIAMKMTSGTFLYPILGSGYDFSAYHQFPMPFTAQPLKVFQSGAAHFVPLGLIIVAQFFLLRRYPSRVLLVATSACLASSIATGFATGGDDNLRYIAPLITPTLLLSYLQFSGETYLRPVWKPAYVMQAFVFAVLLIAITLRVKQNQYTIMWAQLKMALTGASLVPPETKLEYAKLSAALPREGLILTTLQKPFLLEPLNERILLADYPGCASLPPGWPVKENGEALASYLLSHSIRYLAYSYVGNEELTYCSNTRGMAEHESVRSQIQYGTYLLADKQYRELRQSRRLLYDDGKVFVIDLSLPAQSQP